MSKFIIAGFILLIMFHPISVGAYGKTTVDPNISKINTSREILGNGDITQKVTYEAKRKTVSSILADLNKMTGVTLKAGYNNEDWQVKDRRMNIFVKDIPLSNLMNSIARVMKFKWSKSENDASVVSYRLYMDRNVLLGAERQRYIEEEKLKQCQAKARKEFLSGMEAFAEMSESDLAMLKTQSPYIYNMAKLGWASLLTRLLDEVPTAKQAWLTGQELAINIGSLSLDAKQSIINVPDKPGLRRARHLIQMTR